MTISVVNEIPTKPYRHNKRIICLMLTVGRTHTEGSSPSDTSIHIGLLGGQSRSVKHSQLTEKYTLMAILFNERNDNEFGTYSRRTSVIQTYLPL